VRRFLHPRFWPIWALCAWMKLTAWIPSAWAVSLHKRIGPRLGRGRHRAVVQRNLEICFPELGAAERDELAGRYFEALGAAFAESAIAWFAPDRRLADRFELIGLEHVQRALERGKGVILFTGHFTGLEICGRPLKWSLPDFVCMFSHRSNALLDAIQLRGRMRCAHEAIASDDVRSLLKSLRRNAVVWYAPDQAHLGNNASLAPFFGELAMTNTATSRIARISGARVVPFAYRRCGNDAHYELRFLPALEDFPSADPDLDARRLNELLEEFVRASPDQYLWSHKRFKGRPGLPDVYGRGGVSEASSPPIDPPRTR
jgi:Kdo2-lipid IVA lauroyltransferase/acyltransferase